MYRCLPTDTERMDHVFWNCTACGFRLVSVALFSFGLLSSLNSHAHWSIRACELLNPTFTQSGVDAHCATAVLIVTCGTQSPSRLEPDTVP